MPLPPSARAPQKPRRAYGRESHQRRSDETVTEFLALNKFRQAIVAAEPEFAINKPLAYRAALTSIYLKVRKAALSNPNGPVLFKKQFGDAIRLAGSNSAAEEFIAALGNPNFPIHSPRLFDETFISAASLDARDAAMRNPNVHLAGAEARLQMALLDPSRAEFFAGVSGWEVSSRRFEEIVAGRPVASVCAFVRHAIPKDLSGWKTAFTRCAILPDIKKAMSANPRLPDEVRAVLALSAE
jgi:hypothetical protein